MGAPSLEDLPTEALRLVAQHVGEHRPSLRSFALASRTCHAVAAAWLFRSLRINVAGVTELRRDVDECIKILGRSHSHQHVRWLEFRGSLGNTILGYHQKLEDEEWAFIDEPQDRIDGIFRQEESRSFTTDHPFSIPVPVDGECWIPIIDLLRALPHLQDLVFNCYNQFPPSVFAALRDRHPACRLHLVKFRFRSLRDEVTDAHELALATSPLLHSLGVRYVYRDTKALDDYNSEAAMRVVRGLAPNLKKVKMMHCRAVYSRLLHFSSELPRKPWGGFRDRNGRIPEDPIPAALDSLSLAGGNTTTANHFQTWHRFASLASLKYLNLASGVDAEALQWAALNASFPSLTELEISFTIRQEENPAYKLSECAAAFFSSLPPLEILRLSGLFDSEIFSDIVRIQGGSLRKLSLTPSEPENWPTYGARYRLTIIKSHILQLQQCCPLLEALTLPVRRQKGNAAEVETYRALGQMGRLTTLSLALDCSIGSSRPGVPRIDEAPTVDEFTWQEHPGKPDPYGNVRRECVRFALLNSAVDETLARSIWDCINASKVGRPLLLLKIRTVGGTSLGNGIGNHQTALEGIVGHIGRAFLLERSIRDDDDGSGVSLVELNKSAREARDEQFRKLAEEYQQPWGRQWEYPDEPPPPGTVFDVFRELWPRKEGSLDWRDDWSSLPLQV